MPVAIARTTEAPTEAAQQEDYEYDYEYETKRHERLSVVC
jgi:hypothetical protein